MSNLDDFAAAVTENAETAALLRYIEAQRLRERRFRTKPKGARRALNRRVNVAAKEARRLNRTNKRGRSLAPRGRSSRGTG